jgi:hypothetical protein
MMCHVADGRLDCRATLRCNSLDIIARNLFADATLTEPNRAFAWTPGLRHVVAPLIDLT